MSYKTPAFLRTGWDACGRGSNELDDFETWIMLDDIMDHVVDPSQNVQASGDVD